MKLKHVGQAAVALSALTSVSLAAMAAQGAYRNYYANDPVGRNVVMITSQAPLETMLIRTNQVTGEIHVNPDDVLDNPQARFEVDMASLDTGIALRNEHMRAAGFLDTANNPKAVFTLTKLNVPEGMRARKPISLQDGKTYTTTALGNLQFHGTTKQIPVSLAVNAIAASDDTKQRLDGDLLHVRATFTLKLDDFGLNIPAMAKLKIANEEPVTVDIFSSTGSKAPEGAMQPAAAQPAGADTAAAPHDVTKLEIHDLKVGDGAEAAKGKQVTVHYRGILVSGKQFDASYDRGEPFSFKLGSGQVIKGWDKGVAGMKVGGKRQLLIPPDMGYGDHEVGGGLIPANSTLVFEVELLKVD